MWPVWCVCKRTSCTIVLTYHPQAKVFVRMTSSIKTLNIRTAVNASRRSNDSEWRIGSILAHLESAAHMERQLADLREKEMRIASC